MREDEMTILKRAKKHARKMHERRRRKVKNYQRMKDYSSKVVIEPPTKEETEIFAEEQRLKTEEKIKKFLYRTHKTITRYLDGGAALMRQLFVSSSKYKPHQGDQECARRRRQMANGTHGLRMYKP